MARLPRLSKTRFDGRFAVQSWSIRTTILPDRYRSASVLSAETEAVVKSIGMMSQTKMRGRIMRPP
jgi:hypothetical protein